MGPSTTGPYIYGFRPVRIWQGCSEVGVTFLSRWRLVWCNTPLPQVALEQHFYYGCFSDVCINNADVSFAGLACQLVKKLEQSISIIQMSMAFGMATTTRYPESLML